MEIKSTGIKGLLELTPKVFKDDRGWFFEFFKSPLLEEFGISNSFIQENVSYSKKGVVRGLHFQLPPFEQVKIGTVMHGKVLDVVVDLRKNSETFGKHFSCVLDSVKHNLLVIPGGFAHGFAALEDSIFYYKCSNPYNPTAETGIIYNDPNLNIDWKIDKPILSKKDMALPTFEELLQKSVISRNL